VHDAAMSDAPKPRTIGLVLVASAVTLVATIVRVVGEAKGWDPRWFSSDPPVSGWFDIAWLAALFGLLFGRRLAQGGSHVPFVGAFFVPLFALVVLCAGTWLFLTMFQGDEMRDKARYFVWVGPGLALLALFAWPRAFATNLLYAVLARAPVVGVQLLDVKNGWQTHYRKLPVQMPPLAGDELQLWLALAEASFWIPFTVLLGGAFAALGAKTVKSA
jgi:hypothetical protein